MVYTTKFNQVGMFKLFVLNGVTYQRVGKDLYKNISTGAVTRIASISTTVKQSVDQYSWST